MTILDEAVASENAARSTETGRIVRETRLLGDRPSGRTPEDALIVAIGRAVIAAEGCLPELSASSTDANVAISMGLPTVTIASGIGGRAHSLDEYLDVEPGASLRQIGVALTVLLAEAGVAAEKP